MLQSLDSNEHNPKYTKSKKGKNSSIKSWVSLYALHVLPSSSKGTNPPDANDMTLNEGRIKVVYCASVCKNKRNILKECIK